MVSFIGIVDRVFTVLFDRLHDRLELFGACAGGNRVARAQQKTAPRGDFLQALRYIIAQFIGSEHVESGAVDPAAYGLARGQISFPIDHKIEIAGRGGSDVLRSVEFCGG